MMPISKPSKATIQRRPGSTTGVARVVDTKTVQAEVEALERLDFGALRIQWRNRWGRLAPASLPRGVLYRVMAYRIQAEAFGGLDRETVRLLDRLAKEDGAVPSSADSSDTVGPDNVGPAAGATTGEPTRRGAGRSASRRDGKSPMVLKPGALLTREWQGRIERVMALERGFAWSGQTFTSLSGVAFAITGVKWSGQRFFFGSAGRNGSAPAAEQSNGPPDLKRTIARRPESSMDAGTVSAPTTGSPPSSSAAFSADRPNWRRNGKAQERSLSRDPER